MQQHIRRSFSQVLNLDALLVVEEAQISERAQTLFSILLHLFIVIYVYCILHSGLQPLGGANDAYRTTHPCAPTLSPPHSELALLM